MLTSPEPAAVQAPQGKIVEALVRMGRAVQKATIYPDGHPAIPGAVASFLEALRSALEDKPVLSIGIASDRFLADGEPLEERHATLQWLAGNLHGRGLASVDLNRNVSEDSVVRFVKWLATPDWELSDEGLGSAFEGITLKKLDYGRARFGESPAEVGLPHDDPIRAWQAMMGDMTAGWGIETGGWETADPAVCAQTVNAAVAKGDGADAGQVASRVIAMGGTIPGLPAPVRNAIKARLGAFIGALTPELRAQLLRVDPNSSRQKMEFVAEMVDALPKSTVVEILGSLDQRGARVPHQFITLMNKLIGVSARDESLHEQIGSKLESIGVPRSLMDTDPVQARDVLMEVMQSRVEVTWNPERYQELLEDLSSRKVDSTSRVMPERYGDPCDQEGVTAHVSEIALRLVVTDPEAPEAPEFVKCLEKDAPRALDSGRYEQVHEAASAVRELSGTQHGRLSPELAKRADSYLASFTKEEAIQKILAAAIEGGASVPAAILGLFHIAGTEAVYAGFTRLAEAVEGPERDPIIELLGHADPDAFSAAVARLRTESWQSLRVLFPVLQRIGAPRGPELALTFVGNEDHRVRVEAIRILLATDPRPGQVTRYIERALADESPRVVSFGIVNARQRGGAELTSLLGSFLKRNTGGAADEDVRVQAIGALASFKTVEARDILIGLLSERKVTLWVKEVRVSSALEEGLLTLGDEVSKKALKTWHRSSARWLSMLLVRGKVKGA